MRVRRQTIVAGLICGGLSLGMVSSVVYAADAEEFALDEYVVTANRVPVKINEVAADVTVIDNEHIEKGVFSKISDILKANHVSMGGNSIAQYPIINGDSRVLVLVDGRRMNWSHLVVAGNGKALNIDNLPVKNIERIEIVRGPNSSLYGSDAVGGVINIITKKATKNRTTVTTEYGSWNTQRHTLTTEGIDDSVSWMFTYDKQKRGNFKYNSPSAGVTREFGSSSIDREYQSLRVDKTLKNNDMISFELEHREGNDGYGLSLGSTAEKVKNGTTLYTGDRDDSDLNLALTYSWNQKNGAADYFRVYQNHNKVNANYGSAYTHDLKAVGSEWKQSWKVNEDYNIVGGAEVRKETIDTLSGTKHRNADITTSALFFDNLWKLQDNWSMNAGARYDRENRFGGDFTSHLSLNKVLSNTTNAYLSWGQAIKNPVFFQMFATSDNYLDNEDLQPEKGQTITLGVHSKLDHTTDLQASIYKSDVKNAIVWTTNNSVSQYQNVDCEKRHGLEITLTKKLSDQWNMNAGYSYSKVEQKKYNQDTYALDTLNSRPNGYTMGFQYAHNKWNGGVTLLAANGRDTKAYSSSSYMTLDMNINYQADATTKLYLKGLNLGNEAYELASYSTTLSGRYPAQARFVAFGVEKSF